jgi:hypothetical protein
MNAATAEPVAAALPPEAVREAFLNQIPSETTQGERRLLFDLFRRQWDGAGHVVEIGPFLGGTTRAIAWGMAHNPRLAPDALLHTYDRFDAYYSAEQLRQTVEPLVRNGGLAAAQADELCATADFERLFHAIHAPHAYAGRVRLHNSPLPDRPEEIDGSAALTNLDGQGELGALFIDGCKSWASTHYAMKFLLPRTRVGAPVIFQDYGWYTCFWITAVTHALREFLEYESRADATYVFRLKHAVSADGVAKRFARTPVEMGETFFRKSAAALLERSQRDLDLRAELIAQLHHVAALITIGRRGAAADILKRLDVRRYAGFANMIRGCLKSPTYLPGGKSILWREAA